MATTLEIVEATERAEKVVRDVAALQKVNSNLAEVIRELEDLKLMIFWGEESDAYWERLLFAEIGHTREDQDEIKELFSMLWKTYKVAEPVASWTGEMAMGHPVMKCDVENCLWDCYWISYSHMLKTAVILYVQRNETKERLTRCSRSK